MGALDGQWNGFSIPGFVKWTFQSDAERAGRTDAEEYDVFRSQPAWERFLDGPAGAAMFGSGTVVKGVAKVSVFSSIGKGVRKILPTAKTAFKAQPTRILAYGTAGTGSLIGLGYGLDF